MFPLVDIEVMGRLKNSSYGGERGFETEKYMTSEVDATHLICCFHLEFDRSGGGAVCMSRLMTGVGDFEVVLTFKASKIINKEVPLQ